MIEGINFKVIKVKVSSNDVVKYGVTNENVKPRNMIQGLSKNIMTTQTCESDEDPRQKSHKYNVKGIMV